jgi:hypothetical protein
MVCTDFSPFMNADLAYRYTASSCNISESSDPFECAAAAMTAWNRLGLFVRRSEAVQCRGIVIPGHPMIRSFLQIEIKSSAKFSVMTPRSMISFSAGPMESFGPHLLSLGSCVFSTQCIAHCPVLPGVVVVFVVLCSGGSGGVNLSTSFVWPSDSSSPDSCSLKSLDDWSLAVLRRSRICLISFSSSVTLTSVLFRCRLFAGGAKMHGLPAFAHLWHCVELASGFTKHLTFETRHASQARFKA